MPEDRRDPTGAAAELPQSHGIAWNGNQQDRRRPEPAGGGDGNGARRSDGSGYPSRVHCKRGASTKIESTAANDSWNRIKSVIRIPGEEHDRRRRAGIPESAAADDSQASEGESGTR